jgi:hypothetical protein
MDGFAFLGFLASWLLGDLAVISYQLVNTSMPMPLGLAAS